MRILVIENDPEVPVGRFADIATEAGHELSYARLHWGDSIPRLGSFDAVVVLGGGMGAYDTAAYPYLVEEKVFLSDVVRLDIPALGFCLGSQLLAEAVGGRAYQAEDPEAGFVSVTAHAPGDPLADALGSGRHVVFHRDTFDLPQDATVLASTGSYVQGFRCGSAVGIQSHPELTAETLAAWLDDPGSRDILERGGTTATALAQQTSAAEDEMALVARSLFEAWFTEAEQRLGSP